MIRVDLYADKSADSPLKHIHSTLFIRTLIRTQGLKDSPRFSPAPFEFRSDNLVIVQQLMSVALCFDISTSIYEQRTDQEDSTSDLMMQWTS